MTKTLYLGGHSSRLSDDARSLSVNGTTDKLAGALGSTLRVFYTKRLPCRSCGCKCRGKLALNDRGKSKLRRMRKPLDNFKS